MYMMFLIHIFNITRESPVAMMQNILNLHHSILNLLSVDEKFKNVNSPVLSIGSEC